MTIHALPERIGSYLIIRLPAETSRALPSRGLVMAEGTLNGIPYTAQLEPDGSKGHWLEITDELAELAGVLKEKQATLTVNVVNDWPEPGIPEDIMSAFVAANLIEAWDSLTVRARWEWLRWIRSTSSEQTRANRIKTACSKLSAGDRRPCCFNSASCTIPEIAKAGILLDTQPPN